MRGFRSGCRARRIMGWIRLACQPRRKVPSCGFLRILFCVPSGNPVIQTQGRHRAFGQMQFQELPAVLELDLAEIHTTILSASKRLQILLEGVLAAIQRKITRRTVLRLAYMTAFR